MGEPQEAGVTASPHKESPGDRAAVLRDRASRAFKEPAKK